MLKTVTSRSNPSVRQLLELAKSARERRTLGQTLLDGAHLVRAAMDAGIPLKQLVVSESGQRQGEIAALLRQCHEVPALCLPDALFRSISPVDTPSGLLAVIDIPSPREPRAGEAPLIVLDRIQDGGNLGTILRTAAAAGIEHALLSEGCAQAWAPRVLRAGMGGHFHLHIHEQLTPAQIVLLLKNYRGKVIATELAAQARPLYALDLRGPTVWLFGAEGQGLSDEMRAIATIHAIIPMQPAIESLNVAAAAAICLFEQRRQRLPEGNF